MRGLERASRAAGWCLVTAGCVLGVGLWRVVPVQGAVPVSAGSAGAGADGGWDRRKAALYLDEREVWWQAWPKAQRDHGTVCVSCHTVVPYAMARPGLQRELGENEAPTPEKIMLENLERRVSGWNEMASFYSDAKNGAGKTEQSRSTEAVLNAVVLASLDVRAGHLRPITRTAFDNAWARQEETGELAGGWKWQDFHLAPWESAESGYQGAAMLMMEAVNAPNGYAQEPAVRAHLERLRDYLRRGYGAQPVVNQLYVLWASAKAPGLLSSEERKALLAKVDSLQQADGGWRTAAMAKSERGDHSPDPTDSDGYATGLTVLAMEQVGVLRKDKALARGLAWLTAHQEKDGAWSAVSLNKVREPGSDAGPFMRDAATGYAVMALEGAR